MPIKLNTKHSSIHNTIEELYTESMNETTETFFKKKYQNLIDFTKLIDNMFPKTIIWALTSHERLVLMNENDWKSDWYVIIANIGTNDFYFEYLVPIGKSPWKNAYIRGEASSIEEARMYLLISMKESCGWLESNELEKLYLKEIQSSDKSI